MINRKDVEQIAHETLIKYMPLSAEQIAELATQQADKLLESKNLSMESIQSLVMKACQDAAVQSEDQLLRYSSQLNDVLKLEGVTDYDQRIISVIQSQRAQNLEYRQQVLDIVMPMIIEYSGRQEFKATQRLNTYNIAFEDMNKKLQQIAEIKLSVS